MFLIGRSARRTERKGTVEGDPGPVSLSTLLFTRNHGALGAASGHGWHCVTAGENGRASGSERRTRGRERERVEERKRTKGERGGFLLSFFCAPVVGAHRGGGGGCVRRRRAKEPWDAARCVAASERKGEASGRAEKRERNCRWSSSVVSVATPKQRCRWCVVDLQRRRKRRERGGKERERGGGRERKRRKVSPPKPL